MFCCDVMKVVVATTHTTKEGGFKIVEACTYPLTGRGVVDVIITELAVFHVVPGKGLLLMEVAKGVTVEEIRRKTGAVFELSPTLQEEEVMNDKVIPIDIER